MRLNGWQRLWVLLVILWLLPVVLFSYGTWPTTGSIPKADVYKRLKPEDGRRLTDYYVVVAEGWTDVVEPPDAEVQKDKNFMAASVEDQKAYLAHLYPDFAKASLTDQNAWLGRITGIMGPTVDIEGHSVTFVRDIPQNEMNQTARAYDAALKQILTRKRAVLVGWAFAFWALPAIALYALGFGVSWVRRGFITGK
jgi:hypothetical protein